MEKIIHLVILFALLSIISACAGDARKTESDQESAHSISPDPQPHGEKRQRIPYYRFLTGHISDDLYISMHLHVRSDSSVDASYVYQNVGRPIGLSMQSLNRKTGKTVLVEYDPEMPFDDQISGKFEGNFFDQGLIQGSWSNADGTAFLPFLLNDAQPQDKAEIGFSYLDYTSKDCENPEDCISLNIMQMQISGIAEEAARKINEDLNKDYIRFLFSNDEGEILPHIEAAVDSLEYWMGREREEIEEKYFQNWEYHATPYIMYNENNILSFQVHFWSYTGGAHGNPFTLCYNYDLKTGEKLSLKKLLPGKNLTALKAEALRRLKLTYEGAPSDDLSELGFLISDGEFELSEEFYYCPAGVGFVYSPYEIGPYAMGTIEVFVPN